MCEADGCCSVYSGEELFIRQHYLDLCRRQLMVGLRIIPVFYFHFVGIVGYLINTLRKCLLLQISLSNSPLFFFSYIRILKPVKIVRVIYPASPSPSRPPSPTKVPVITTSGGQQIRFTSPQPKMKPALSSPIIKSPGSEKLTNGLSSPPITNGGEENSAIVKSPGGGKSLSDARMKSPQPTSRVPISSNVRFEPSHYRYFVEEVQNPEEKHTMKPLFLNRSKGVFTPKKLRVFLRCSTYRTSEKQPFAIKVGFECVLISCVVVWTWWQKFSSMVNFWCVHFLFIQDKQFYDSHANEPTSILLKLAS